MATTKTEKKTTSPAKKPSAQKASVKKNTTSKNVAPRKEVPKKEAVKKESTSSTSTPKKRMTVSDLQRKVMDPKNRRSLLLAIGIIGLGVILYLAKGLFVAATVNGQPISRLAVIRDLERQNGQVVLDSVITKTLVAQEASKKNIEVSEKEVEDRINKIKKQFADQGQNLDQLLSAQGLTQEKFKDEVKMELTVTKLLGDNAKVNDKEFNDFLAKNPDILKDEKDQNAAKTSLREQLSQQKLAQKYQEWIANLKKNAKINHFVSY